MPPSLAPGIIVIWQGAIVDIPAGWVFCDGNNGTPDLRASFILGALPPVLNPDDTGGANTHDHTFTGDGHDHNIENASPRGIASAPVLRTITSLDSAVGTTDSGDNLPPFYVLAYIMKV